MLSVTTSAPVNIAVVKYWGKRNEELILPVNSSLSGSISQDDLKTVTSIALSSTFERDRIWLNGVEEDIKNPRLLACLAEMRRRARPTGGLTVEQLRAARVHIVSENNFPTAAGLASSASGYACLVFTLSQLLNVEGDVSAVARLGSGSACRSLYGGFVRWEMGTREDGSDSLASQVVPETHWPEMRVLVLVVSDKKKDVSSTSGMLTTVQTSSLMAHRAAHVVPARMKAMEQALQQRDFAAFAELTMRDSNSFHAVCLDTYPPISYMTDISRRVVQVLTRFNGSSPKVAYTFDAGPNAVIYLLEQHVPLVLGLIDHFFPSSKPTDQFFRGLDKAVPAAVPAELRSGAPGMPARESDAINYVLCTRVGGGPRVMAETDSLVGKDGLPLVTKKK